MNQEKLTALLIELLLAPEERRKAIYRKFVSGMVNWDYFLKVTLKNGVFCQVYETLNHLARGQKPLPSPFTALAQKEADRRQRFLEKVSSVLDTLRRQQINAVVLKSFDRYPDLGKDIDIYVGKELEKAIRCLSRTGMVPRRSFYLSLFNRHIMIDSDYQLPNIDLYPSFARFREQWLPDSDVFLKRQRELIIEKVNIPVASAEAVLLVHGISSIYFNGAVGLNTIWVVHQSVNTTDFDQDYFIHLVDEAGISLGMHYLLSLAESTWENKKLARIRQHMLSRADVTGVPKPKIFPHLILYRQMMAFYMHKITSAISRRRAKYLAPMLLCGMASMLARRKAR